MSLGNSNAKLYYFLGLAYSKIGLQLDAEQSLKYAIAIEPDFLEARLVLAGFYSSAKNYADALEQYRIAAKLDTQNRNLVKMIRDLEGIMAKRGN